MVQGSYPKATFPGARKEPEGQLSGRHSAQPHEGGQQLQGGVGRGLAAPSHENPPTQTWGFLAATRGDHQAPGTLLLVLIQSSMSPLPQTHTENIPGGLGLSQNWPSAPARPLPRFQASGLIQRHISAAFTLGREMGARRLESALAVREDWKVTPGSPSTPRCLPLT